MIRSVKNFFTQVFIFLLPVQAGYHFWPSWAYVFGIRVDYFSPTLYLTDLLGIFLFFLWVIELFNKRKRVLILKRKSFYLIFFFLFASVNIVFSLSLFPALLKWAKLIQLIFLGIFFKSQKKQNLERLIIKPLLLSLGFFSLIGVAQFLKGESLGLFYFLGERNFSVTTPGISLVNIAGRDFLRSYSTFSHPNSLAGFVLVGLVVGYGYLKEKGLQLDILGKFSFFIGSLAILLSFSANIFLSLLIFVLLYLLNTKAPYYFKKSIVLLFSASLIFSISAPFFSERILMKNFDLGESYSERLSSAATAGKFFSKNPLNGVGLNNFILASSKITSYPSYYWKLQPVHNIFLLVLAETGIIGLFFFLSMFFSAIKNSLSKNLWLVIPLALIVTTGLFDHYWLTLQQNQLLFSLIVGLALKKKEWLV